jgi:small subunit ribosomal protein S1
MVEYLRFAYKLRQKNTPQKEVGEGNMSDQEVVKDEQPVDAEIEAAPELTVDNSSAEPLEGAGEAEPVAAVATVAQEQPVAEPTTTEAGVETLAPEDQPAIEAKTKTVAEAPDIETPPPIAEAEPVAEASPEPAADSPATESPAPDEDDPQNIFNLKSRQHLSGKVKNITAFGAFIDLGLPQDGLVHISELARKKVEKVEDVVSVGQEVDVWVKKIDRKRGRISLTMIRPIARRIKDIDDEDELEGTVTRLEAFGAFINIDSERDGLVHISQITHDYIKHPEEALEIGQKVNVKVLKVNRKKRQIDLSIKALVPPPVVEQAPEQRSDKNNKEQKPEFDLQEQEPVPTAMAVAFASLQGDNAEGDESSDSGGTRESRRRKRQQEELIARTLANN